MDSTTKLCFFVNGKEVNDANPDPEMTLLYYLRRKLNLTGSKLGCGEGGCGACTVMVSRYDHSIDAIYHYTVNACLASVCSIHGMAITTVEGIGSIKEGLHPCQERIAKAHGSQCGFCTPGFVMSMYTLLRNNPRPTEHDIELSFEGNLCRCTGYRPILDGYKTFCTDCPCGASNDGCCKEESLFDGKELIPYPTKAETDYIFPPKLKVIPPLPLNVTGGRVSWYQPVTLKQLVELRDSYPLLGRNEPQYRIVLGNTEIGVETRLKKQFYPVLMYPNSVQELLVFNETENGILTGAGLSLSVLDVRLKSVVAKLPLYKTRVLQAIIEMLKWFAGPQIRNVASLAGNIVTASPISDLIPILMACRAELTTASIQDGRVVKRSFVMDQSFITGYRTTSLRPNEVLVSVLLPYTKENEFVMAYKQSRRQDDDIAIVNSCFRVIIKDDVIEDCNLVFGGMSFKTVTATKTETTIIRKKWNEDVLSLGCQSLADELLIDPTAPGGMPDYRLSLALSFFYKFYLTISNQLTNNLLSNELSATKLFERPVSKGSQGFKRVVSSQPSKDPVGRPMMSLSSLKQASGEAKYVDDLPYYENELYAGLVLSQRSHALYTMDTTKLQGMEGVCDVVTVNDIPGSNITGLGNDELVFANGTVTSVGQIMAIVLAKDKLIAQRAVRNIDINYTDLPSVLTIEDARKAKSFHSVVRTVKHGNTSSALSNSYQVSTGTIRTGGQEHFYLETNACLVIPKGEEGEMEIIASTQHVDGTQRMAATALGIPANRIVCKVKRIGGGFGGKESRSFNLTTAMAVAANKVGVPVRVMMERNEDMIYSGTRHPFLGEYKAGFTKDGLLTCLELELFCNSGYSCDLSIGVLDRALTHSFNSYNIPNTHLIGKMCLTNTPSNTAFRGFGGPQGMMIAEDIMDRAASELNMDPAQLRYKNLVTNGATLPYSVVLDDCHMTRCWDTLMNGCDYQQRKSDIEKFNNNNKWTKRGIAIIPTMYGISFGLLSLNQGSALIHVYRDGSVLLTHGGIEMGQGLHTKIIQVCSHCFDIPTERIFISETSSDKIPNTSPTAASSSSDLYGAATQNACEQIMSRLKPFKEQYPNKTWDELVSEAYNERVNLSAQGFYKTPGIGYDWETGKGRPYNYYCYGVGCSEVEIDTLTGGFKVLRTDLLMDVGNSINPAIDIGQVEGAFAQGLGLFTMEEVVYLKDGKIFTNGPGNYKIPSCTDVPIELNVSLMDRTPNPRAIFSSKAVGEPPLFLAASVFFSIKDAIRHSRVEKGYSAIFDLIVPATAERIRMACEDQFTDMVHEKFKKSFDNPNERWNVIP